MSKFVLVCAALTSLFAFNANAAGTEKNCMQGKSLTIAISIVPPFVMPTESKYSKPQGIDIDILEEIQKRLGYDLVDNKYVFTNQDQKYKLLSQNKVDLIAGGIWATNDRKSKYAVSPSYYTSSLSIVVNQKEAYKFQNLNDLKGKRLAHEVGDTVINHNERSSISHAFFDSPFSCLYAVKTGKADAYIFDTPTINYYLKNWKGSNLAVVNNILAEGVQANSVLLFNKDFAYQQEFNDTLNAMIEDGTVQAILDRYI